MKHRISEKRVFITLLDPNRRPDPTRHEVGLGLCLFHGCLRIRHGCRWPSLCERLCACTREVLGCCKGRGLHRGVRSVKWTQQTKWWRLVWRQLVCGETASVLVLAFWLGSALSRLNSTFNMKRFPQKQKSKMRSLDITIFKCVGKSKFHLRFKGNYCKVSLQGANLHLNENSCEVWFLGKFVSLKGNIYFEVRVCAQVHLDNEVFRTDRRITSITLLKYDYVPDWNQHRILRWHRSRDKLFENCLFQRTSCACLLRSWSTPSLCSYNQGIGDKVGLVHSPRRHHWIRTASWRKRSTTEHNRAGTECAHRRKNVPPFSVKVRGRDRGSGVVGGHSAASEGKFVDLHLTSKKVVGKEYIWNVPPRCRLRPKRPQEFRPRGGRGIDFQGSLGRPGRTDGIWIEIRTLCLDLLRGQEQQMFFKCFPCPGFRTQREEVFDRSFLVGFFGPRAGEGWGRGLGSRCLLSPLWSCSHFPPAFSFVLESGSASLLGRRATQNPKRKEKEGQPQDQEGRSNPTCQPQGRSLARSSLLLWGGVTSSLPLLFSVVLPSFSQNKG